MDSLCVCVRMCSDKVEIAMESVGEGGGVCVSVCVCVYIYIYIYTNIDIYAVLSICSIKISGGSF